MFSCKEQRTKKENSVRLMLWLYFSVLYSIMVIIMPNTILCISLHCKEEVDKWTNCKRVGSSEAIIQSDFYICTFYVWKCVFAHTRNEKCMHAHTHAQHSWWRKGFMAHTTNELRMTESDVRTQNNNNQSNLFISYSASVQPRSD